MKKALITWIGKFNLFKDLHVQKKFSISLVNLLFYLFPGKILVNVFYCHVFSVPLLWVLNELFKMTKAIRGTLFDIQLYKWDIYIAQIKYSIHIIWMTIQVFFNWIVPSGSGRVIR